MHFNCFNAWRTWERENIDVKPTNIHSFQIWSAFKIEMKVAK